MRNNRKKTILILILLNFILLMFNVLGAESEQTAVKMSIIRQTITSYMHLIMFLVLIIMAYIDYLKCKLHWLKTLTSAIGVIFGYYVAAILLFIKHIDLERGKMLGALIGLVLGLLLGILIKRQGKLIKRKNKKINNSHIDL